MLPPILTNRSCPPNRTIPLSRSFFCQDSWPINSRSGRKNNSTGKHKNYLSNQLSASANPLRNIPEPYERNIIKFMLCISGNSRSPDSATPRPKRFVLPQSFLPRETKPGKKTSRTGLSLFLPYSSLASWCNSVWECLCVCMWSKNQRVWNWSWREGGVCCTSLIRELLDCTDTYTRINVPKGLPFGSFRESIWLAVWWMWQ